jgi:hypothetical protein
VAHKENGWEKIGEHHGKYDTYEVWKKEHTIFDTEYCVWERESKRVVCNTKDRRYAFQKAEELAEN